MKAGRTDPAHANSLAYFDSLDAIPFFDNGPDDLMAWDERIDGAFPVVIDQMDICMAKTAMGDFDENFLGRKRRRLISKRLQIFTRSQCGISMDFHRTYFTMRGSSHCCSFSTSVKVARCSSKRVLGCSSMCSNIS